MTKSSNTTRATHDTPTTHTLSALEAALGSATLDESQALVEGASKATLVKNGASIATSRISTDAARMYGDAFDFLAHATETQLDQMPLFNRDWLRVAAWTAFEGDRRYRALADQGAGEADRQAALIADADAVSAQAEAKRGQLHVALNGLAAGTPAQLEQVANAYGSASDPGAAIRAQTKLARVWRAEGSAAVKARLKSSRLTEAWLAAADALADRSSVASKAAAATRSKGALTQGDVDYVDGLNLSFLQTLVATFEAGHGADPSIPRIAFNALNSHVHRVHHAAPSASASNASAHT